MRYRILWLAISLGCLNVSAAAAAEPEMKIRRDVPYLAAGETGAKGRTLDVYAPAAGENRPAMIYIHGGGWRRGDKSMVHAKPADFVRHGWVFVSVNYRLVPQARPFEQAGDVAQAVAWVHAQANELGVDANRLHLMGHSAGAHLAAVVGVDRRHLERHKLSLANLRGVVLLDGAAYDVARQKEAATPLGRAIYDTAFGSDAQELREVSPTLLAAKETHIPPFLLIHVASRTDSQRQSAGLAQAITQAGYSAKVVAAENKTHGSLNQELGTAQDPPTAALWQFLESLPALPEKTAP